MKSSVVFGFPLDIVTTFLVVRQFEVLSRGEGNPSRVIVVFQRELAIVCTVRQPFYVSVSRLALATITMLH